MVAGVNVELMSFTFWVKWVTKSSAVREEGGGGEGGVRREENMENSFLGLEAEELILDR